MRFERLNEDKIRIILNNQDLIENDIDFHSFMANPIESQTLFFEMLNKAEKEIGFVTKNYNIKIEAMQVTGGNFIITITRSLANDLIKSSFSTADIKNKVHIKRKKMDLNTTNIIYCFNNFDDFCNFAVFLQNNNVRLTSIAKNISLYDYNNKYYLTFSCLNFRNDDLKKVFSSISEFATYISNADLFKSNLTENGNIVMKNNAIITAAHYFS